MYEYRKIASLIECAEAAATYPIESSRYGVTVYVDTNPDDIAPDIYIDPADTKGIAIFREFAAKMAAHYNTLLNKIS